MSDTPIQPPSGGVANAGVALALALSIVVTPTIGSVSASGNAPVVTQATSKVITPTVGAITVGGNTPTIANATNTNIAPTVGALAAAGIASSVLPVNQTLSTVGSAYLLTNASASGTLQKWPGGLAAFSVSGGFNGATVTLSMLGPDGLTLLPVSSSQSTLTSAGVGLVYLPACIVQAVVTGGTPSGLYATLARVPTQVG